MLTENRNGRTVSESSFDRNAERQNVALALALEVTEARADDPENASHVALLGASLERLGIDLVEVARLKADGLLRVADVKTRQIRGDTEDRAKRVLREADARLEFVNRARDVLGVVERFFETPEPVDEAGSTITPVPMRELPAIHWHPAGSTNIAISPSDTHERSRLDEPALLVAGHQPAPTVEVLELAAGRDDVATSDEVTTTEAPRHARVATTPVRRRRVLRRSLAILSVVGILIAGVLVLPGLFETTDDASAPVRTPSTVPLAPLASIDVPRFLEHWTQDFASLAPPGSVVSKATVTDSAPEASTNEFDALATALATDRVSGSAGIFVRKGAGARAASGSGSESRAAASVSSYASSDAAAAAYDAAQAYYIGDLQPAAGDTPIKLAPNVAVRSFGYRRAFQGTRTLTAYLEFPGVLVQLTTSGDVDELTGMIALVGKWAAQ